MNVINDRHSQAAEILSAHPDFRVQRGLVGGNGAGGGNLSLHIPAMRSAATGSAKGLNADTARSWRDGV
jgi:hypothetical protein